MNFFTKSKLSYSDLPKVLVVGQGYVGLPIAVFAATAGYEVVGYDLNLKTVENLNSGKSHILDIEDNQLKRLISMGK